MKGEREIMAKLKVYVKNNQTEVKVPVGIRLLIRRCCQAVLTTENFGKDAEVRHCAFIRGNAIVGEGAVVGNSTELKNVVLFNKVQVPHYNYVGDSILGYKSHMGAGSITSNVKSDKKLVVVKTPEGNIETGMKKFGAMLGDHVEVGCGTILNPGSVVGPHTNIYPLSSVRGFVPGGSIYKCAGEVVEMRQE